MGTQGWDEYHIHQTKRVSTKDQTNRWKERERERERERGGGRWKMKGKSIVETFLLVKPSGWGLNSSSFSFG